MKLLDVNVWLAAAWARHRHHGVAKRWLDDEEDDLAFCRVTQMALLRLPPTPRSLAAMCSHGVKPGNSSNI
jgi:predicted nucleic acid-binding protein